MLARPSVRMLRAPLFYRPIHGHLFHSGSPKFATKETEKKEVLHDPATETGKVSEVSASKAEKAMEPAGEAEEKPSLWTKIKKEASHFWQGTKLLGYEIRISSRLVLKMATGRELSRREDRQLRRTIADLGRLVPFSMFVIVPFAELLLPIALKLFPNMLPSTYESKKVKESKVRRLGQTRTKVSEYLRKTKNQPLIPKFHDSEQKKSFEDFFRKIAQGEQPSREHMLVVARLFTDDMLLDDLSRPQLAALARYMNLSPFGTNMVLRYSLRHRMRIIKQDDRIIDSEGVESLNTLELQHACQSRGFQTVGVSTGRLREDLANWLQLRLHDRVPSALLILSSAFTYGNHDLDSFYDGVLSVLSSLPPEVYHEAELTVGGTEATYAQRLEVLKEQQELIQDENKEEEASGHVIGVKDNLNVDDDHEKAPMADPTESEMAAKADQEAFESVPSTKSPEIEKPVSHTESEEAAKADQETYAFQPANATISEMAAKADEVAYEGKASSAKTPETEKPVDATESEMAAKADEEEYAFKPADNETESEMAAKADEKAYENKGSGRDSKV